MLLLKLGLELPNLVKKLQSVLRDMDKMPAEFPQSGTFPRIGMYMVAIFLRETSFQLVETNFLASGS